MVKAFFKFPSNGGIPDADRSPQKIAEQIFRLYGIAGFQGTTKSNGGFAVFRDLIPELDRNIYFVRPGSWYKPWHSIQQKRSRMAEIPNHTALRA